MNPDVPENPDTPEAGTPSTVLFAEVRKRLLHLPFEPFRIVTTSGLVYDVPTGDHASVLPVLRMIYVADDRHGSTSIHALHVSAVEPLRKRRRAA